MVDDDGHLSPLDQESINDYLSVLFSAEKVVHFQKHFKADWSEVREDLIRLTDAFESIEYFLEQFSHLKGYERELYGSEQVLCARILSAVDQYVDDLKEEKRSKEYLP